MKRRSQLSNVCSTHASLMHIRYGSPTRLSQGADKTPQSNADTYARDGAEADGRLVGHVGLVGVSELQARNPAWGKEKASARQGQIDRGSSGAT